MDLDRALWRGKSLALLHRPELEEAYQQVLRQIDALEHEAAWIVRHFPMVPYVPVALHVYRDAAEHLRAAIEHAS